MSGWGDGPYGARYYGGTNAGTLEKILVWSIILFVTWALVGLLFIAL